MDHNLRFVVQALFLGQPACLPTRSCCHRAVVLSTPCGKPHLPVPVLTTVPVASSICRLQNPRTFWFTFLISIPVPDLSAYYLFFTVGPINKGLFSTSPS